MPEVTRAIAAATSVAASLGLPVSDAVILHNSNKLALRLMPCDVFARVAPVGQEVARLEVELAQRLAEAGCPVAALEPRVDPLAHTRDGFTVTLWTYYEPVTPHVSPVGYARALERLHAGMRKVDVPSPRFTDRIAEAEEVVASRDLSPKLADADRVFLGGRLGSLRRAIEARGAVEQLLHGEPHPGNVLAAVNGPAIGLGNDVACLCDTRIAADTAIFGATFLKIGLIPGDGGAWLLPRIIGMARASELLYTGDTIDAKTAEKWGLVSEVVPAAELMSRARAVAENICGQAPDVLRMTKQLLRQGMTVSFDNIMELSATMQALAHHTGDHKEALDAFFDKRPANYKGE